LRRRKARADKPFPETTPQQRSEAARNEVQARSVKMDELVKEIIAGSKILLEETLECSRKERKTTG
jgi:hypothetical protein